MLTTDKKVLERCVSSNTLWMGIPSIEYTRGGRTFITFYAGGTKEEIGNYVGVIKSDDGVNFSEPIVVCCQEGYRCFDAALWIDPLGRLWLTWSRCPGDGLYGAICDDPDADEIVFGEEFFIGHNVMMNKPIVLSTGEWAFPIAVWNHGVRAIPQNYDSDITPKGSFVYITSDNGKTFRKLGYADIERRSYDEHMLLEMENGALRLFARTTYGIGASDSYDGGLHFGKDFDTGYKGPCSRFHIRRMPSGRILLINHYDYTDRDHLTAMLSEDDGKTFPYRLLLDDRKLVSYPDAALDKDGRIHIVYDRDRGSFKSCFDDIIDSAREILTACITEEDIINGSIVTEGSYLARVAYKLTDYKGEQLQNPFNEEKRFTDENYVRYLTSKGGSAEQTIAEIFDACEINCLNVRGNEAETLDKLIEDYKNSEDLKILSKIVSTVRAANRESEYSGKGIVDEICKYIIENLDADCSIKDIAKQFSLSSNYIRHIFKKQTGTSITEFKKAQIIKKAKLLLKTCNGETAGVSASCGFEDPSCFSEVFTREVGISPKDYYREHKNDKI